VLGLERMRGILDRLGEPDRRLGAIVHVGGTNGKGSTVAMIAALAAAAGQRVATYTSPHLSCLRERIAIGGAMIPEPAIVAAAERVRSAGGDELTFFEQITAIAMVAIAGARVDVTVLEVGLGGRLDATNVVDPVVAVVTGVALDHEAILGDTIAKIAVEKAGIWKPGRPAIIGASGEAEAVPVLARAARAVGAIPRIIGDAEVAAVPLVGLLGAHQRRNAAAAIAAVRALGLPMDPTPTGADPRLASRAGGVPIPRDRTSPLIASVLASVRHPGHFEIIEPPAPPARVPRIILDRPHNPHGALALAEALRERGEHPVLIVAVSADKDVAAIARALAPSVRTVVATRYQQDRAMDPAQIAAVFTQVLGASHGVAAAADLAAAIAVAAAYQAPIVIAGSLFLVGEARTLLLGAPADPIFVTDPPAR